MGLQLLYMTAPLFVALLGAAVLAVPIPWFLWPSLLVTIIGAGGHPPSTLCAPLLLVASIRL